MHLLNYIILHRNDRTCQERGVCQSTTRQCRKECHQASGEPPIGYEAAYIEEDEKAEVRADQILAGLVLLILLIFGVLYSLITPDSFLHQLGRAAMSL